jgi:hypothetical protein
MTDRRRQRARWWSGLGRWCGGGRERGEDLGGGAFVGLDSAVEVALAFDGGVLAGEVTGADGFGLMASTV